MARKISAVLTFEVFPEKEGKRLDVFLSEAYPEFSRSFIKKLIKEGFALVDGNTSKPSYRLKAGQKVTLFVPEPEEIKVEPEPLPLEVLYEDGDVAVILKRCGIVVHPSPGYTSGTLVNALLYHFKDLSSVGGVQRPGIVHRLDKDTTGLMVIAKNDKAHRILADQFAKRKTEKLYKALVVGLVREDHKIIESPIARHPVDRKRFTVSEQGRESKTEFWVLKRFEKLNLSLLKVKIYTGRTHQIRVHLSSLGHPIVGDTAYGFKRTSVPKEVLEALGECNMLLAYKIGFFHPSTEEWMSFEIEDPSPFKEVMEIIKKIG